MAGRLSDGWHTPVDSVTDITLGIINQIFACSLEVWECLNIMNKQ